jgi:hypothetical protein
MSVFIFLTCALCGILSGVVYDVLYIARVIVCGANKKEYTLKDKIFTGICDVLYFAIFAAMFLFTSVLFSFYKIRLYMLLGAAFGAFIYLKSLHIFLAFLLKKVYNNIKLKGCKNKRLSQ